MITRAMVLFLLVVVYILLYSFSSVHTFDDTPEHDAGERTDVRPSPWVTKE